MNKFDLDADTVTLDYEELLQTARVGVRYARVALERELKRWYKPDIPTNIDAEWMLDAAKALATATITLHYLVSGKDRKDIIIRRV